MSVSTMRNFGGDIELKDADSYYEHTISGRSSLRLIIECANLQAKRFLVPEYVCDIVLVVLEEFNISYDFYSVDSDLEISLPPNSEDYDVLYLVKYFGGMSASAKAEIQKWKRELIVDDVFSPNLQTYDFVSSRWFTFNSLRKITPISGFSQIRSNIKVQQTYYSYNEKYDYYNYEGKSLKYFYKVGVINEEQKYLDLLAESEKILDEDARILMPSSRTVAETMKFYSGFNHKLAKAKINYKFAYEYFNNLVLELGAEYRSHIVLKVDDSDGVRRKLKEHSIFLPKFWPQKIREDERKTKSNNYLVIPTGYSVELDELKQICQIIQEKIDEPITRSKC